MSYRFNISNTTEKTITVKWYDWNDGSWLIPAKTYDISSQGNQDIDAYENVVIQIGLYEGGSKIFGEPWMNFYATKRNMKIVENQGVYSIEYR